MIALLAVVFLLALVDAAVRAFCRRRRAVHPGQILPELPDHEQCAQSKTIVHVVAKSAPLPPTPPLLELYSNLARAFAEAKRSGVPIDNRQPAASFGRLDSCVRSLIEAYLRAGHTDWRHYVEFNQHHYVRHLVEACPDFELMLICWSPGQGSHVHNHADSHCWLTVMEGSVAELQYRAAPEQGGGKESAQPPRLPGVLGATRPCPTLHHLSTAVLAQGGTAYINDHIALHSVACPTSCPGQGAVTLHLYAPPIRRVELYQADEDRVVRRVPGFCTMRGQKSAA